MWAEDPRFPGYEASIMGDVRRKRDGKLLMQRPAKNGRRVQLGRATAMVHHLVLRAHTGHPLVRGYRPKHLNRDLSDNRLENLVWSGRPKFLVRL